MANRNGNGTILFAYDGSDQAKAAIREAARQLSPDRDAIVLTVWQPLAALPFGGPGNAAPDLEDSIKADAQNVADEGASLATSVGFKATALAEDGSPVWRSIVDSADQHDASIVVMSSHGRTGIEYVLMGSVAAAVARHADRPVLIFHPPADRPAAD
jgi:nucleotide-binding universal stress UspA family protein